MNNRAKGSTQRKSQNREKVTFYFSFLALRLTLSCISFCALGDNRVSGFRLRSPIPFIEALSIGERFGVPILSNLLF